MPKRVSVRIPATSANLGPGFDVLGVALSLCNDVSMAAENFSSRPADLGSAFVVIEGAGRDSLPRDQRNGVVEAARRVFQRTGRFPKNLVVRCVNRIPMARGLGSSAAATLGGMLAANVLCGRRLSEQELLQLAVSMEGHPDNLVPAMYGGLCVSHLVKKIVRHYRFPIPPGIGAVICVPEHPVPTAEARRVLPSRIPFGVAVFTSARVAFLLGAFACRKWGWLSFAMDDALHQPARAKLVPGLRPVIQSAQQAGAWGAALSGAGSSVIALVKPGTERHVGEAMVRAFRSAGLKSQALPLHFENRGARISSS